eukprot:scaffold215880_cov30-Tisochrysis_lutea.AAC.2
MDGWQAAGGSNAAMPQGMEREQRVRVESAGKPQCECGSACGVGGDAPMRASKLGEGGSRKRFTPSPSP